MYIWSEDNSVYVWERPCKVWSDSNEHKACLHVYRWDISRSPVKYLDHPRQFCSGFTHAKIKRGIPRHVGIRDCNNKQKKTVFVKNKMEKFISFNAPSTEKIEKLRGDIKLKLLIFGSCSISFTVYTVLWSWHHYIDKLSQASAQFSTSCEKRFNNIYFCEKHMPRKVHKITIPSPQSYDRPTPKVKAPSPKVKNPDPQSCDPRK